MPVDAVLFLKEFSRAIHEESAAIFVGAGTSAAAGYPTWKELLADIAEELQLTLEDVDDLAAVAQWSISHNGANRTRVLDTITRQLAPTKPIPSALKVIARLPLRQVWTTNFDRLVERAYEEIGRPIDPRYVARSLALRQAVPGAVRLYKMHGSIEDPTSLVFSTEDFELYRHGRSAFIHMLQAHLASRTFLFCGISLTDPNMRHVLGAIREHFPETSPTHFLTAKRPARHEFDSESAFKARLARHQYWASDLTRYGFQVLEVDEYREIDLLLEELERRIARRRVWVSGSWPASVTYGGVTADKVGELAEGIGRLVARRNLALVSGSGLLVGPLSLRGFLTGLQEAGSWDLERRLIVRPFPQPNPGAPPNLEQWGRLREEMARLAGIMIVIGGAKLVDGVTVPANGVVSEAELVRARGGYVLPIGASGGVARELADQLTGSAAADSGPTAVRPTDDELRLLGDPARPVGEILSTCEMILRRLT